MSLIGEALRKTRREAAEREVERRGVLYSARIADAPTRSNLGLGLLLGALIAVVATVVGGVAVWWLFIGNAPDRPAEASAGQAPSDIAAAPAGDNSDSQPREPQRAAAATAVGTVAETAAGTGAGAGAGTPAEPVAVTESVSASESGSESESGSGSESTSDPDSEPVTDGDGKRRPSPAAAAETSVMTGYAGTEDGDEVYILEAEVGGAHLALDYIVYRSVDPFAEINGIEVHQGSTIAGFRVKAIEKDRVRLSDGRRSIVLRAP